MTPSVVPPQLAFFLVALSGRDVPSTGPMYRSRHGENEVQKLPELGTSWMARLPFCVLNERIIRDGNWAKRGLCRPWKFLLQGRRPVPCTRNKRKLKREKKPCLPTEPTIQKFGRKHSKKHSRCILGKATVACHT